MASTVQGKVAPEWITPEAEKGKPDAARYKVRPLDGLEMLDALPHMEVKNGLIIYSGEGMRALIRHGLVDWENHIDPETKEPLSFSREAVSRIHSLRLFWLANEIANRSELSEAEAKNSARQSESGDTPKTSTAAPAPGNTATQTEG